MQISGVGLFKVARSSFGLHLKLLRHVIIFELHESVYCKNKIEGAWKKYIGNQRKERTRLKGSAHSPDTV